jgi:hypothetical protein
MESFYIAGSVLAVWALLVSFLGITRKNFPSSATAERAVGVISAILVIAAVSAAVIASANEEHGGGHEDEGGHEAALVIAE